MSDDEPDLGAEVELSGVALRRRLATTWLLILPLLLVYEAAVVAGDRTRNSAELFLVQVLRPLGDGGVAAVRLVGVVALTLVALWRLREQRRELPKHLLVGVLEGAVAGILLGPLLLMLTGLIGQAPAGGLGTVPLHPSLLLVAFKLGGAAWEELLFRFILYLAVLAGTANLARFLGADQRLGRGLGEVVAVLVTSFAFAAFHLESVIHWLGEGGEPFQPAVFTWRALAGLLLALLARRRGLGCAAWAHAVLNLGLVLGAGPGVFRA